MRSSVTTWFAAIFFILFSLIQIPSSVDAHTDNSQGKSNITAGAGVLHYELSVDIFELGRVVDLGNLPEMKEAELSGVLSRKKTGIEDYLSRNLEVFADGVKTHGEISDMGLKQEGELSYARIDIDFPIQDVSKKTVEIHYNIFFDDNDRLHRNIAHYELGTETGEFILTAKERTFQLGKGTLWGQVKSFVQLGFHHILIGLDHILFVIALLLCSKTLKDVMKVVSVFTLSHSVSLGLSALHLVSVSPDLVEPLIALSIVFVAFEYLFFPSGRYRLWIVFGFGLIHGLGFSGGLEITGDLSLRTLLSILCFNLGVEGGQAMILLIMFPVILLVRRNKWGSMIQGTASAAISLFGFVWYVQRFFG
ncbi:HupE/UreJ family protein [Bacillus sp. sid0103]|uniref:HupE/UreJ family protein n=1 Tax=Bacillus sp. sid0103 TaxID=2856337 RepID=UPI001C45D27E|nr:HupE/UreJ family protein [Bacillus sp. sid0103]MBV7508275.1 HupE/UreJ family protein [Bacillus sp. sid0103]